MGFFKKLVDTTKDYNRIANAVGNVKNILDSAEYDSDINIFLLAAWVCRVGIIDVIEKNDFPMTNKLFISINGHNTRMTIYEAYMMSVGRLSIKVGELNNNEVKDAVLDILAKGEWFYKMDKQIPESKKVIFI